MQISSAVFAQPAEIKHDHIPHSVFSLFYLLQMSFFQLFPKKMIKRQKN